MVGSVGKQKLGSNSLNISTLLAFRNTFFTVPINESIKENWYLTVWAARQKPYATYMLNVIFMDKVSVDRTFPALSIYGTYGCKKFPNRLMVIEYTFINWLHNMKIQNNYEICIYNKICKIKQFYFIHSIIKCIYF